MRDIQSIDDIKRASDSVTLPSIDVREKVMQEICIRKEKQNMFKFRKLMICISVSVCLLCVVGFAALKTIELKDSQNSSYKYDLVFKDGKNNPEQAKQIKAEWEKLNQGEALAIFFSSAKDNPTNRISILNKYKIINNIDEIKKTVGLNFKAPASMPEGFEFKEGQVGYGADENLRNEMIEESKTSGKPFILKTIKSSDKINDYSLKFINSTGREIDISVFYNWVGREIDETAKGQKATKIGVNNGEGVLIKSSGRIDIKWLDSSGNGSDTFYSVGCASGTLTKDELLKIAESFK